MTRILCFGDSITLGYSDYDGGWPIRLQKKLENIYIDERKNRNHAVINLGIDADTSEGVKKRIEAEIKPRGGHEPVVIIAIGVNDSAYYPDGSRFVEIERFEKNLESIIKSARKFTDRIVILGLGPCDESLMQPMPWAKKGESYSNESIATYNSSLENVAQQEDVIFVNYFTELMKQDITAYLHDGLHPNSAGHQYIADRLFKEVEKLANGYEK